MHKEPQLLTEERRNQIISILNTTNNIVVNDLASKFKVSVATIRRDLTALENLGKLKRVYGGAISSNAQTTSYIAFNKRITDYTKEKDDIAKEVLKLLMTGDTILLSIGTTTLQIAKKIKQTEGLTVLSNSLPVINELAGSKVSVFALGGKVRLNEFSIVGNLVQETLSSFHIDKAIIGCGGFSLEDGITEYSYDIAQLSSYFIKHSDTTILVTDSSKFGKNVSVKVENSNKIETIVTDNNITEEWKNKLSEYGYKVIIAQG